MSTPTIFGREPAVIVGLLQAVLALALSFGWLAFLGLNTQNELALFMAVAIAALDLYVAYVTRRTLLAFAIGLFKSVLAFGTIYGFQLSTEQTGYAIAIITFGLGFAHQSQTEPTTKAEHSFDLAA